MNSSHGSGRHPSNLRGREIGMFYRNQQKHRNSVENRVLNGPSISLTERTIYEVSSLIKKYRSESDDTQVSVEFEQRFNDLLRKNFDEFLVGKKKVEPEVKGDPKLNEQYQLELEKYKSRKEYKTRYDLRMRLPAMQQDIVITTAIAKNQVVLIVGNTGCGKTTQIPQFILDHYIESGKGSECRIVCTQPRRISAITVAEHVAYERTEEVGHSVGYQIRLQGVTPRQNGSILYCTTGTLLRRMETDPLLYGLSHLFLDEIHERSVETDLLMGLLKKILPYRKDLRVILMSATVSQEDFQEYFDKCATITISGTLYPVECKYLEDVLQEIGFRQFEEPNRKSRHGRPMKYDKKAMEFRMMIEPYVRMVRDQYYTHVSDSLLNPNSEEINILLIEKLILYICEENPPGAILVFLPGFDKISKLNSAILKSRWYRSDKHKIYTLHSTMPTISQKGVFQPPPYNVRKIILSTNIAESSVTIDDVVYVINSGKMKCNDYDIERNMQTLEEKWITLANAQQRKGRAGRVRPGICYHLYTRARESRMDAMPTPEIIRSKLEGILLNLKLLHIHNVATFLKTLLSCPDEKAVVNGIHLLKRINALDENEVITPLGMHLARLPIDPQMGKMILMGAIFRCLDPITSVASTISYKDPFYRPLGKEEQVDEAKKRFAIEMKSDHLMYMNVIDMYRRAGMERSGWQFCDRNFLSQTTLMQLERMKIQFCELLQGASFTESSDPREGLCNINSKNITLLRAIITAGLYPNVAHLKKVRQIKNRVQPIHSMWTPTDHKVKFHPSSVNFSEHSFCSHYFTYFLKQKTTDVFLMDTTMIYPMALIIFGDGITCDIDPYGRYFLSVADFFYFKSDKSTNELVMELRFLFRLLLQKKALYPSPIVFGSKDDILINAIKLLISHDEMIETQSECNPADDD